MKQLRATRQLLPWGLHELRRLIRIRRGILGRVDVRRNDHSSPELEAVGAALKGILFGVRAALRFGLSRRDERAGARLFKRAALRVPPASVGIELRKLCGAR